MFLFWVNGSHSVKATWSSSGWRRSEPRADILLMIGQSVFCCKRHWASQELSKQEAPSWGITRPVCTHARDRVGQRDREGWEGGYSVCMNMCGVWCECPEEKKVEEETLLKENVLHLPIIINILDWQSLLEGLHADLTRELLQYDSINHKKHLMWFNLWCYHHDHWSTLCIVTYLISVH